MRSAGLILAALALVSCNKATPEDVGETVSNAAGVAFSYRYQFRLPSTDIADVQEAHAQACEKLPAGRCRITDMSYRVDRAGDVSASLDVSLEAAIARPFGRNAVKSVETAGGALQGAEIDGTDAKREISLADNKKADIGAAQADVEKELLQRDLTPAVRAKLLERRAELAGAQRESTESANAARDSVQLTSMSFSYEAGAGVGLMAGVAEAGHQAYSSLTWTVATLLTVLAYLGPPFLVLLLLVLLWQWHGRCLFRRLFPPERNDG